MIYSVPSSWYYGLYRDRVGERRSSRSFTLSNNFYRAVLLVHGYAGYPGEMVSIAEYLYSAGFDCYVPRLPGMGTSGKDFSSSGLSDWLGLVENALSDLRLNYQKVYAVGHSMGCSLLALADGGSIDKAVMVAPPLRMKHPVRKSLLKQLKMEGRIPDLPWQSDPSYHLHYDGAPCDDGYYGAEYWSHLYPAQMLDLYDAMSKAAPLFKNPKYLNLYGSEDALCSYTPKVLENFTNYKKIEKGTHYMPYDKAPEAEMAVLAETLEFLDERIPAWSNEL